MRFILFLAFIFIYKFQSAGVLNLGLMLGANTALNSFSLNEPMKGFDSKLGYNANAFARIGLAKFIIQPEIGYLSNRASFTFLENGKYVDANLNLGQFYTTALFGFKLGNIRLTAGPLCIYNASQSSEQITSVQSALSLLNNSNNLSWGGIFDIGVNVSKRWSIDARVIRSFTKSDFSANVNQNITTFQGNTGLISLNLGYTIFKTK